MVTLVRALARLTVRADVEILDISAVADVLLSLIVQNGADASVPEKLSVTEDTLELLTIEPRRSVDPAVIEAHPVPHVGVPPLPFATALHVMAVEPPPPERSA